MENIGIWWLQQHHSLFTLLFKYLFKYLYLNIFNVQMHCIGNNVMINESSGWQGLLIWLVISAVTLFRDWSFLTEFSFTNSDCTLGLVIITTLKLLSLMSPVYSKELRAIASVNTFFLFTLHWDLRMAWRFAERHSGKCKQDKEQECL